MSAYFATLTFPDIPRAKLRAAIAAAAAQSGHEYPAHAFDEATDLAIHAAQSARRTMLETIDRASSAQIGYVTMGLAASLVVHEMERLMDAMRAAAIERGDKVFEGTMKELAHG